MIFLSVEGIKGNGLRIQGEKGLVKVDFSSDIYNDCSYISINSFEGFGSDYHKKENGKEEIIIKHKNKEFKFNGIEELINQLEK